MRPFPAPMSSTRSPRPTPEPATRSPITCRSTRKFWLSRSRPVHGAGVSQRGGRGVHSYVVRQTRLGGQRKDDAVIRTVIAEPMPLIRAGLAACLADEDDIEVLAELERGDQVIPVARAIAP